MILPKKAASTTTSTLFLFLVLLALSLCTSTLAASGSSSSSSLSPSKNSAILFLKPHANTDQVRSLLQTKLNQIAPSMCIKSQRSIASEDIEKDQLIDEHYYAIASKATIHTSKRINGDGGGGGSSSSSSSKSGYFSSILSKITNSASSSCSSTEQMIDREVFRKAFEEDLDENVLDENRIGNALEACQDLNCNEEELLSLWRDAEQRGKVVKLGGGFYIGQLENKETNKPYYVLNAFFMSMRSEYVQPNSSITIYELEWDPKELPWSKFRNDFLGGTDPAKATKGSLRNLFYRNYKSLGIGMKDKDGSSGSDAKKTTTTTTQPSKGMNGAHGSASPLEGMSERCNWLKRDLKGDEFGNALMKAGVPENTLMEWCKDPRVKLGDDEMGSLFDTVEDMDVEDCFEKLLEIYRSQ